LEKNLCGRSKKFHKLDPLINRKHKRFLVKNITIKVYGISYRVEKKNACENTSAGSGELTVGVTIGFLESGTHISP
jgi:hypothetical protein